MKTDDVNRIINDLQENIKAGADINAGDGGYSIGTPEAHAEFVAKRNWSWKDEVIDQLVCCHIYNGTHDNDPRKAVNDLIAWHVQVALDPQVSSDAQALIDRGSAEHSRLQHLVKTFFDTYLNRVEESESGRLFFPIVISNCRAATITPLNDLLDEMAKLSGAKPRPEINNDF